MDQRQLSISRRQRLHELDLRQLISQPVAQHLVFAHGETMAGGQRQDELRSVKDLHAYLGVAF